MSLHRVSTLLSRKLAPSNIASSRIFDTQLNKSSARTGRDILRKPKRGDALVRWYPKHIRTIAGLQHYRSKEEIYKAEKTAFYKSKGKVPPKKGAGKKALKRLADQKKKEAKAKK